MTEEQKFYIVEIESFAGKDTGREQYSPPEQSIDSLYAIVIIGETNAEIIDDGYRTYKEAKEAWPQAI
jgi:hypothetical protein